MSASTGSPSTVALEVHRRVVAVDERVVAVLEVGEAVAELIDLAVDRVVVDRGEVELDAQALVAGELDDGTRLDHGVELHRTGFLARGDLDLRRRDDVDLLGDDRVGVEAGQPVLERLLAPDLGAETRLEETAGRLAGTEPGDAHLVGELAERGVDRRFELGLGDRDVELDLVGFERFDRRVHGAGHLTRGPSWFCSWPTPEPLGRVTPLGTGPRQPGITDSGASRPPRHA